MVNDQEITHNCKKLEESMPKRVIVVALSPTENHCCCFKIEINRKNYVFSVFLGESINLHTTVVYKTCVGLQHDIFASENSSIAKSLQCVLTRSDVFTGPPNFQFLLVFDQTLCQTITKVLNLIGCMLFSVSLRFIITIERVLYRNANQCICLECAQRFYQNDVLT